MARVELKNLRKEWLGATPAVAGVDLAIEDGAFVAVLGPSGCGKTTTLMMLAGIYQPTGGEITFDGARVNDVEARGRNVGIVFQSYALYPNMSVLENVMFPLRFKTIERPDAERRAREIAALVRVDGLLDRRPSQLSGGQQQRVAHWSSGRICCCSTSRCRTSTPACGLRCAPRSAASSASLA